MSNIRNVNLQHVRLTDFSGKAVKWDCTANNKSLKTTVLSVYYAVASICFQHCEGPKSLPSPLLSSYSPPFPSLFFPFPLEVAFLIQLGDLGSAVSSHSGSGAKPQPPTILVHFEGEGKLLVAFKMHGFKQQKTAFPYIFMKKFSKS